MSIYELEDLSLALSRLASLVDYDRLSCDIDSLIDSVEAYIKARDDVIYEQRDTIKDLKKQVERLEAEINGQH